MKQDTMQLKCYYFKSSDGLLDMKLRLFSALILNNNNVFHVQHFTVCRFVKKLFNTL